MGVSRAYQFVATYRRRAILRYYNIEISRAGSNVGVVLELGSHIV